MKDQMLWALTDYREILQSVFAARVDRNKHYSLRAFARDLDVSPALLSEVFKGRKGLSPARAQSIAEACGFGRPLSRYFSDLVAESHGRSAEQRSLATLRIRRSRKAHGYNEISDDTFAIIADWYHFAILEAVLIPAFSTASVPKMAKALGISEKTTKAAIDRLIRVGLLERQDGFFVASTQQSALPTQNTSKSIRTYHQQILQKAAAAIEGQDAEARDLSALVLTFNRKRLAKARDLIRAFRQSFPEQTKSDSQDDEVYCLSIQLFRLVDEINSRTGKPVV